MTVSKITNAPSQKGIIDKVNEVIDNLGGSVSTDGITINKNTSDELQSIGVIDNNSGDAIGYWSGTRAEYEAMVADLGHPPVNVTCDITDDNDMTLTLLELLYPVGSIYIGTMSVCPLQTLGVGTWQLVASDRVLQGAGTRGSVGNTLNESLPNITGYSRSYTEYNLNNSDFWLTANCISGAYYWDATLEADTSQRMATSTNMASGSNDTIRNVRFDASRSSSTYQNNAPVQQDAYLVNIWERIS